MAILIRLTFCMSGSQSLVLLALSSTHLQTALSVQTFVFTTRHVFDHYITSPVAIYFFAVIR